MTYCVAWKSETAAFLMADSAVTYCTEHKDSIDFPKETTFGEIQGSIDEGKRYVYEKTFKLYSIDKVAITFAGDVEFGNDLIKCISDNLSYSVSVYQAIQYSVNNYQDFSSRPHVKILIACHEEKPEIYFVDNRNKEFKYIEIIEDFISFGTLPEKLKNYSHLFYDSFKESREKEKYNELADEIMLLRMLGLIQSYGVHYNTTEKGAGGAYHGLYITKNKLHWQPDICYLLLGESIAFEESSIVAVYIRDNCSFIVTKRYNIALLNAAITYSKSDIDSINK